jgi:monomeric sarcosine oxidase
MPYDVAVIGAGVFGAFAAYHLRQAGCSVLLVDAYGPGNSRSSSGGESRIIRMGYGPDEIYTRSAMRSLDLWRRFQAATGQPIFHPTGVLWTAIQGDPYTEATRQTLTRCGVTFELLTTSDLAARFPQMCFPPDAWGIFEPHSGALMARRAVAAVAAEAVRIGVTLLHDAVAAPTGYGALTALRTPATEIHAGNFVFACGAWLPRLFPDLLGQRILPTRQEAFFFATPPGDPRFTAPAMPVWIDFSDPSGPYGFPDLESRGVKIALDRHGPPADPETLDRLPSPEALAAARDCLARRFPALQNAPLTEARVCQYENTSNGDFLIDRHPDFTNVWLLGGGSGHGFKHGPAVGESTAAALLQNRPPEPRYALAAKHETQERTVY